MTTHDAPDPVNRWATEHYGFDDEPGDPPRWAPTSAQGNPATSTPTARPARVRHGVALVGGVLLGALLTSGTVGAVAADDRGGGGRPGDHVGGRR